MSDISDSADSLEQPSELRDVPSTTGIAATFTQADIDAARKEGMYDGILEDATVLFEQIASVSDDKLEGTAQLLKKAMLTVMKQITDAAVVKARLEEAEWWIMEGGAPWDGNWKRKAEARIAALRRTTGRESA